MPAENGEPGPARPSDKPSDVGHHPVRPDVAPSRESAHIISAIERFSMEGRTRKAATDFLKEITIGYLAERDSQVQRMAALESELARARAERDVARSRLDDLRDINVLHNFILAFGTALLGSYASYHSAGKEGSFSILLYLGMSCVVAWGLFLVFRSPRRSS